MMKKTSRNFYTQRQWDRTVGWGKIPREYEMPSSENMMRISVLQNELDDMRVLQKEQYTDEDMIVRKWLKKRIKALTEDGK